MPRTKGSKDYRPEIKLKAVKMYLEEGMTQPVAVGYVDEHDPLAVQRWLEPLVQRMGIGVIVTDDLAVYKVVAQRPNLEHQICQFHVRRWVGRTLKELQNTLSKEWLWGIEGITEVMEELPKEGNKRLSALWKQVRVSRERRKDQQTPDCRLRDLLIRLSENWPSFCAFYADPAIPWTNNGTEQVIGRKKLRARTVRGYKT
jgi:hypothetical protein